MNYKNLLQKALREKSQVSQTIGTLIIFNSNNIVEGIRRRWLFGKDPNGDFIHTKDGFYGYRNINYQQYKVGINSLGNGNVDLTLTGALGRGLTIKKKGTKEYEIFSTDSKFDKISDKYGIENFNMDQQQTTELFDMLHYMVLEDYLSKVWLS